MAIEFAYSISWSIMTAQFVMLLGIAHDVADSKLEFDIGMNLPFIGNELHSMPLVIWQVLWTRKIIFN